MRALASAVRLSLVLLSLMVASTCSRGDNSPPVATVSFNSSKSRVAMGSPIDLTYKFDVAPNAKINGDYKVFVHFDEEDGTQMWNDDHDPSVPTSQWKPGQTVQYTRTVFVPVYPYLGEATVRVGLYKNEERLPLTGIDPADRARTNREYKVGTLQLLPTSENVFVMFKVGWYATEFAPENPTLGWQWTQKQAFLSVRNPRKDIVLYLQFDARTDVFADAPQKVTVSAGDQVVGSFPADSSSPVLKRIPITAAQLGNNEMAELKIEVDKIFVPAKLPSGGRDMRELGIRVYHAFVEPK